MATSRVEVPQDFMDVVSTGLLRTPLPQYAFAQLAIGAQAQAMLSAADPEAALTGFRNWKAQGAGLRPFSDFQLQLAQSVFPEAITVVEEASKAGIGETIKINRPIFSGGGYTRAARTVHQAQTITTTPIAVSMEQVSLTVERHAGPYDTTNSRVAPYAIDRLAAQRSVHDLMKLIGLNMINDRYATLDAIFSALFDGAQTNVVRPAGISADASFPTSGEAPLDLDTMLRAEEALQRSNVPRFSDGTYMAVISATQLRQLRSDPEYQNMAKEMPEMNPLTNSSIIKIGSTIKLMVCTTVQTDTTTVSGQTIYRGVMCGPGAVGFGVTEPVRAAYSTDDNYGETAKVIWLAYEAMGILDERFLCSMRSV